MGGSAGRGWARPARESERVRIQFDIDVHATEDLSDHDREDLIAWFDHTFAPNPHTWRHGDWYILASTPTDGTIARVGIVDSAVTVGEVHLRVGGIGGVITKPEFRRRGIASTLLVRAAEFMRLELRVDFGLLLCADDVRPLYEGLGWQLVAGPTWCCEAGSLVEYEERTMILPCRQHAWPAGAIDLHGPPW